MQELKYGLLLVPFPPLESLSHATTVQSFHLVPCEITPEIRQHAGRLIATEQISNAIGRYVKSRSPGRLKFQLPNSIHLSDTPAYSVGQIQLGVNHPEKIFTAHAFNHQEHSIQPTRVTGLAKMLSEEVPHFETLALRRTAEEFKRQHPSFSPDLRTLREHHGKLRARRPAPHGTSKRRL